MSIIGIDYGKKRLGVAGSDGLGLTAQPLTTINRKGFARDADRLAEICREREATLVVMGLPIRMDGSLGTEAEEVMRFAEKLKKRLGLPIETWDERLSTSAVERVLVEADLSRNKRRKVIDKVAAAWMLQAYLDHSRISAGPSSADPTMGDDG